VKLTYPSSSEFKNACSHNSAPQYVFMACYLVTHRDNFNFTFVHFIKRMHKDCVRKSMKSQGISASNISGLMNYCRKIIVIYSRNEVKPKKPLYRLITNYWLLKHVMHLVTTMLWGCVLSFCSIYSCS